MSQLLSDDKVGLYSCCSLGSQRVELFRWRWTLLSCARQLSLADGMHDFNAGKRTPGRPKRLESSHRLHLAFHRPLILLDAMVERLALPDGEACLVDRIVVGNRYGVAATLTNRDLLRGSPWVRRALRKNASAAS